MTSHKLLLASACSLLAAGAHAQSALYHIDGPAAGVGLGYAVAGPGDLNGDGIPDLAAAAPYNNGGASVGRIYTYAGHTGTQLWNAGSLSGMFAVAAAGDVNHDGRGDVLFGAMNSGAAGIYAGDNGVMLHASSGPPAYGYGLVVAGGADMNGDGTPDYAVGGPFLAGMVRIHSGSDSALLNTFFGPEYKGAFGSALALGDLNGDGFPDLLVGMPYRLTDITSPHKPGRVLAYSGSDGSLLFDHTHSSAIDYFGASVAILDDSDGDGVAEYAVGAPMDHDAGNQTGEVDIFSGASGLELASHQGTQPLTRLGWVLSAAGDVDGDGSLDLVAGTDFVTPGAASFASLYSGRTGAHLMDVKGLSAQAATFGYAVSNLGDVTGDGLPEIAVGDLYTNSATGAAWVVSPYPHGTRPYGGGTSGCGGPQGLTTSASPKLGGRSFDLHANHAPVGGFGLAYISSAQDLAGSDLFGMGVILHIGLLPPAASFSWLLAADANGLASKTLPLPSDPALNGLSVYAQAFWLWPNGSCPQLPSEISSSSGLAITFQP